MSVPITIGTGDLAILLRNQAFLNLPAMRYYARLLKDKPASGCKHCWNKTKYQSLTPNVAMDLGQQIKTGQVSDLYDILLRHFNARPGSVFRLITVAGPVTFNDKGLT